MKKHSSKDHIVPLFMVLIVILGGLYAGWQTHHFSNPVVIFSSIGLISLTLSKITLSLFKRLVH